jgi:hypothetical protein
MGAGCLVLGPWFGGVRGLGVRGSGVRDSLVQGSLALALIATPARAQEPTVAAPKNYKVELENEYVKVTRATFAPREKVPVHLHPTHPTVYVYLTDGGPMRFIHDTQDYTVERAPVRAGGIRYNRNWRDETHVIEYLGDIPTEYLRVELKTTPDQPHRDARLSPQESTPIEDAQVRISRHRCQAGAVCDRPKAPGLVVELENRSFTWLGPDDLRVTRIPDVAPVHQIWIELKTLPAK